MAAEYTFAQLSSDVVNSSELLELALDVCFAEKHTAASYLGSLEARKLQPTEKLSEYVADIKKLVIKGYPTADQQTKETIGLRYFLKGLPWVSDACGSGYEKSRNTGGGMYHPWHLQQPEGRDKASPHPYFTVYY